MPKNENMKHDYQISHPKTNDMKQDYETPLPSLLPTP